MNIYFNMPPLKLQLTVTLSQCLNTLVITAAGQGVKDQ